MLTRLVAFCIMENPYTAAGRVARVGRPALLSVIGWLLLALPGLAQAQAPAVTALSPARNARAAARTTPVGITFSQSIKPATASNIKVYSAQAGGRKAGPYATSGGVVTFTPTTGFKPGETVFTSVPATVQSTGGASATRQVYQFTTAVGGTGRGNFQPGSGPAVSASPISVVLGDVDGDGDLDLLTANNTASGTVSVRLNGGNATGSKTGVFSNGSDPAVGIQPISVAVGDVDGDGDLDLLTANAGDNTVSVRLNGGNATGSNTGVFSNGSDPVVGTNPLNVVLGDVDGDGDLDLFAVLYNSNSASVLLNQPPPPTITSFTPRSGPVGTVISLTGTNLTGATAITFSGSSGNVVSTGYIVASATSITGIVVPGGAITGTLTVTTPGGTSAASSQPFTVTVAVTTLSGVSPAAELPGTVVALTGTGFTSGSTVDFGGTAASVAFVSATSLTATVPAGLAAGSAPVRVTTGGTSSAPLPFTGLAVYDGGTLGACTAAVPATASLNDGTWHYLLSSGGQVVAAYTYTGPSLGDLALDVLRADPAQPVRNDGQGRRYLDRNWHLTASAGRFDGRTVLLRLYCLTAELSRLQAAVPAVTLAGLKATQYSGPNEDCDLANNGSPSERRVLVAPASSPAGTTYFVAQLSVADHFSEFYLTGSATPLPVELTQFTATAAGNAAVRLAWATASELHSQAFEVERSVDGIGFGKVGTVPAAGTSSAPRSYGFVDAQLPDAARLYYRLRQLDLDGTAAYSPVRAVALSGAAPGLALYPNPARTGATLTGAGPGTVVTVCDALGRLLTAAPADATGTAILTLPAGLPTGVYVVRARAQALRLTVE